MITQRLTLFACTLCISLLTLAQSKTKDGFLLDWDHEITATDVSIASGMVTVPATEVPVYEASDSDVEKLLKTVLPGASFKKSDGVYSAPQAKVPAISGTPVDLIATIKEDKKSGATLFALGMLQNGAPLAGDAGFQRSVVRDLGVQLNKAVVQKQLATWEGNLEKAVKNTEGAKKDQAKAESKAKGASSNLDKTLKEKEKTNKEMASTKADITHLEQRWQISQDAKELKKLTKLREQLAKSEKKMMSLLADETKNAKSAEKLKNEVPDAAKDQEKTADSQQEVQRMVDAMKAKLEKVK